MTWFLEEFHLSHKLVQSWWKWGASAPLGLGLNFKETNQTDTAAHQMRPLTSPRHLLPPGVFKYLLFYSHW